MPRTRYLHPKFFTDFELSKLPFYVRLLFAGMWEQADREGRLEDKPEEIKIAVLPYDKVDVEAGLQLLSQPKESTGKPFIKRYSIDGKRYIQVVNWHSFQKPHHTEQESRIPAPPSQDAPSVPVVEKPLQNGSTTVPEPCKHRYGEGGVPADAGMVLLTEQEYGKLVNKFGEVPAKDRIDRLHLYLAANTNRLRKYTSHYNTILSWARKDEGQDMPRPRPAMQPL